jgi:uncharacterized repeat protein (TIGR01451 family)
MKKRIGFFVGFLLVAILLSGCGAQPGIALSARADPTTYEQAGDGILFTYTVTNTGNVALHGIQVLDPGRAVSCTVTDLDPGASTSCTAAYTITDADFEAGSLAVSAIASGSGQGTGCGGNTTITTMSFVQLNLNRILKVSITKTGEPATYTQAGQQITYTYTITNTGNSDIADPVFVQDDRIDVACPDSAGGLAMGASLVCSGIYTVTDADVKAGSVTNTASAVAGTVLSDPVTFTITLEPQPSLSLTKNADRLTYNYAGETINYTFVVTNTGNVPLTELVIVDPIVTSIQCPELANGTLEIGAGITCTGSYKIAAKDAGHAVTNSAGAHGKYGDITYPSNIASVTVEYSTPIVVITEVPPSNPGDFCYGITNPSTCLSYYPVCTTDSHTEQCIPGP